jgi:hypothetical protein
MSPLVDTPNAEAAPMGQTAPMAQDAQQGRINKGTIEKVLADYAKRPIRFQTANLYGSPDALTGVYGEADWHENWVTLDWRLAQRLYELPRVNNDAFLGTHVALATLAHELGHIMMQDNRSEFAATRWGCNNLDGIASRLGLKGKMKQQLVSAAWKNLNEVEGCHNRRDLKTGAIDPEDQYFFEEDDEVNLVRRHEYWHTFWIDPQEINGDRVYVMINPDEVNVGDPVTVKWESGQGRMKADAVVEYIPDTTLADDAFEKNLPVSEWSSVVRIDLDSMEPVVYPWRNYGATDHLWDERVTTKVVYDFDTDRLFLGTMADIPNLPSNKVIGEYRDGAVDIFETEKQWVSPTYFKRLWHHSFPNKELKGVYFKPQEGTSYRLDRVRRQNGTS